MNRTYGLAMAQLPVFIFQRLMEWMLVCFPRETGQRNIQVQAFSKRNRPKKYSGSSATPDVTHDRKRKT